MNKYKYLEWDSTFFSYKVYRLFENNHSRINGETLKLLDKDKNATLIYFSSQNELNEQIYKDSPFEIKLVDIKLTYSKKLISPISQNPNIKPYAKKFPDASLLKLAVESGIYSRFSIDKNIKKKEFKNLYQLWIINSINKEIAIEVLVYYLRDKIIGFVTLGKKDNRADIGIIAVDKEYRGQGIGKALMKAAEEWFIENTNFKEVQVVTQYNNVPARKLYEKNEFKVDVKEYYYHLWNKNHKSIYK